MRVSSRNVSPPRIDSCLDGKLRARRHARRSRACRTATFAGLDEGCAALIDAVGGAKSLKALSLDSVGLSAGSAERLAKALAANRSLSSIDIARNDFGTAIGTILTALRGHPLDHLRIGGRALTEEVFSAWTKELPHLDVRELDIHESRLEGGAGERLARALAGSRVTSLRIGVRTRRSRCSEARNSLTYVSWLERTRSVSVICPPACVLLSLEQSTRFELAPHSGSLLCRAMAVDYSGP
ncbi:MAG: hypothetical protein BGO98_38060 [Myxococcales bacterium 68-20]|nr:MAG: hypothetical protein BGO98_38060 [Myxococcales bacterium 68-20]